MLKIPQEGLGTPIAPTQVLFRADTQYAEHRRTLLGCLLGLLLASPNSVRFTARRVRPAAHADYRPRGVLGSLLRSWATDFNMPALSRTATSPTTCDNCPEIDLAHNADTCQVYNGSDISRRGMIMPQHAKENSGPSGNTQVILQQMESCL